MSESSGPWHIDRGVPLALLAALATQTAAWVWQAASAAARLDQVEKAQAATEKKLDGVAQQAERLVRVETKMDAVNSALLEVKEILRRTPPASPAR